MLKRQKDFVTMCKKLGRSKASVLYDAAEQFEDAKIQFVTPQSRRQPNIVIHAADAITCQPWNVPLTNEDMAQLFAPILTRVAEHIKNQLVQRSKVTKLRLSSGNPLTNLYRFCSSQAV